jgi:hypothetical protein
MTIALIFMIQIKALNSFGVQSSGGQNYNVFYDDDLRLIIDIPFYSNFSAFFKVALIKSAKYQFS